MERAAPSPASGVEAITNSLPGPTGGAPDFFGRTSRGRRTPVAPLPLSSARTPLDHALASPSSREAIPGRRSERRPGSGRVSGASRLDPTARSKVFPERPAPPERVSGAGRPGKWTGDPDSAPRPASMILTTTSAPATTVHPLRRPLPRIEDVGVERGAPSPTSGVESITSSLPGPTGGAPDFCGRTARGRRTPVAPLPSSSARVPSSSGPPSPIGLASLALPAPAASSSTSRPGAVASSGAQRDPSYRVRSRTIAIRTRSIRSPTFRTAVPRSLPDLRRRS